MQTERLNEKSLEDLLRDIETANEDLAAATSDAPAEIKAHLHHRLADLLYQQYMRREDDSDKE
jgi:hypothetical protein